MADGKLICWQHPLQKLPAYYKDISEMTIESYRIDYSLDSKGFYQPDYVFSCILDGVQEEIHIPAIKP